MKGKKFLAGLLSAILAFNSNVGVLAVGGEEDVRDSGPSHTVTITASHETPAAGESVTLTASDVEDADSLQWQEQAKQDAGWEDLENETGSTYTFTWPEEQEQATYRLEATWGETTFYSNELELTKSSDSGDGEAEDEDSFITDNFLDYAEHYYGKDASTPIGTVSISIEPDSLAEENEVLAGQTLKATIAYTLHPAVTFMYQGTDQAQPLFDEFKNTKLYLRLPKGLSIAADDAGELANVREIVEPENPDDPWTIVLTDSLPAATAYTGSFTLNVIVEGNGVLPIGTEFEFAEGEELLSLTTELPILDRENGNDSKDPAKTYEKTIVTESELSTLTSATMDEWGVRKEAKKAIVSEDRTTVTVTYTVTIGLLDDNNKIITTSDPYARYGRVSFASASLTDTTKVETGDGDLIEDIEPKDDIKITPQFGNGTAIFVRNGNEVPMSTEPEGYQIPINTCLAEGVTLTNGEGNDAPYYSEYSVEVTYNYNDFIKHYSDADANEQLVAKNTARFEWQLLDGLEKQREASGSISLGETTQPAAITISKYIVGADNKETLYSSTNFGDNDPVSGEVTFTITGEKNSTPTLYTMNSDGTYEEIEGNTVTLASSGSGSVTVYLDPGTYTVSETAAPDNTEKITVSENSGKNAENKTVTVGEDETETAAFYNKETLGSITITKTDAKTKAPLADAKFGLYSDENCQTLVKEAATDEHGKLTFSRLEYGMYYVKELEAPDGYRIDNPTATPVEIKSTTAVELSFTNTRNEAYVTLTKQIDPGDGEYVTVTEQAYSEYYNLLKDAFKLQKKGKDGTWTDVEGKTVTLGSSGVTQAISLPVYEDDGTTFITYRFAEQLPAGFHAKNAQNEETVEGVRWAYSETFTLEDELGKSAADAKSITMHNTRNGSIEVTKEFFAAVNGKMQKVTTEKASFDLYYTQDNGTTYHRYNQNGTPYTTDENGKLTITDLPISGRSYYLVEREIEGYKLTDMESGDTGFKYETQTITVDGSEKEAIGPIDFKDTNSTNGKTDLSRAVTLTNVEQKVPVVIKKVNSYTNAFVSGARYKIYELQADGNYSNKTPVIGEEDGIEILDKNGSFQKLSPGKKYIVFETTVPEKYTDMQPEGIEIDLEKIQTVTDDTVAQTVTLQNRPDPTLIISKFLVGAGSSTGTETVLETVKDKVEFTVYTKGTDGNFTEFKPYGSTEALVVNNKNAVQLPAGTYYLKENQPPEDALDPSEYHALYEQAGEDDSEFQGEYDDSSSSYYFGPIEVDIKEDQEGKNTAAIYNYSAKGSVQVTKQAAIADSNGAVKTLSGATFAVYNKGTGNTVAAAMSDSKGIVTFSDLSIFDDEGNKITYVIKETTAPDGYTVSDESFEVELVPGETVTTGKKIGADGTPANDSSPLTFLNLPKVNFQVTKVYYNLWEHAFTGKEYLLAGTKIALYQWNAEYDNGEGKDPGAYEYVTYGTTDEFGTVTFDGLNQQDKYIAIEVSIPGDEAFKYLEPAKETIYLAWDEEEDKPVKTVLTKTQLESDTGHDGEGYNYVTKEAIGNGNPISTASGTLVNVENWTQLHIFKYVEDEDEGTYPDGKRPVNNAEFQLYMEVLADEPEGSEPITLTFDPDTHPEKYTLIGTYSSGTLYDSETGARKDGWFSTNILKSADEVVYWLVETEPGPGTAIKPANAITLIKRADTPYTNNSTYTYQENGSTKTATCTEVFTYKNNEVMEEKIENDPLTGTGEPPQYTTVRIAKWADSYTADGNLSKNYTPLGNAVFDLYLVNEDGNQLVKLDTLTTGLDNDLSGSSSAQQELTAWASSRAFSLDDLMESYGSQISSFEDKAGNTYVRAALVETHAPAGYQTSTDQYNFYLFFKKPTGDETTEIFNDVFYVKDPGEGTEVANGEDGVQFALYPTEEKGAGVYEPVDLSKVEKAPAADAFKQLLIVNLPTDNFTVTVHKYGYEVNGWTVNKTSEELNDYFVGEHAGDRVPLSVTMELQRWSNQEDDWVDYEYTESDGTKKSVFTTDDNGSFSFPDGLPISRYRIIETVADPGYENIYDGGALDGDDPFYSEEAYYFSVTTENLNLTLYNPEKLDLSIVKTALNNMPLSGATFTLTKQGSQSTDNSGMATFEDLASGKYVLSETGAGAGYSNRYFAEWFKEEYKDNKATIGGVETSLANFVSSGIFLGFTTALENGEMIVKSKTDLSSYGIDLSYIHVKNPETVSLTVEKQDALDINEKLPGAEFSIEFTPFTAVSGDIVIGADANWTSVPGTHETNDNGTYTRSNLTPGIYRVKETKAPEGYDITDSSYHYVALTGGLAIGTVTVKETAAEGAETETAVTTYSTGNAAAPLVFQDAKHVSLTVTKVIEAGDLAVTGDHTFTFTLYQDKDKKVQVGTTGTVRVTNGQLQANPTVTFTGLSQGGTYYLAEGRNPEDFALKSVTNGNSTITAENDGLYAITVPKDGTDVSVTATNVYLFAEISVRKVNSKDGTNLSGAEFEVYRLNSEGAEESNPISGVTFTEDDGVYTARIPLKLPASLENFKWDTFTETLHVKEKNAPYGYLLDQDQFVEVKVGLGEKQDDPAAWDSSTHSGKPQQMLVDRIFPNDPGAVIEITKYSGIRESKPDQTLENVEFSLYTREDTAQDWTLKERKKTDENGVVTFTVEGDRQYAVAETSSLTGYAGLQGLWDSTGAPSQPLTAAIDGASVTLYPIGSGSLGVGTYPYSAYNTPYIGLEIRKQLVNPRSSFTIPTATVSVYQVPDGTTDALTQDEVKQLMTEGNKVRADIPVSTPITAESYSTSGVLENVITPGATYLIVETESSVPQLRDNKNVVWYKVLHVKADAEETQSVTLENLVADVGIELDKDTSIGNLPSLFEQAADIPYTLEPELENSYPLTSLTITDDGLKAYHIQKDGDGTATEAPVGIDFDTYLKDKYSITSVTVPTASHVTGSYADDDSAKYPIDATVTFYGFDGAVIHTDTVEAGAAERTVTLPTTVTAKAKSISVSYASEEFQDETGYALGQDVELGAIQLTVHLDQQTETGTDVHAISLIDNHATAAAKYRPWDTDGEKGAEIEAKAYSAEPVNFAMRDSAIVSVTKEADTDSVRLGDLVTYTVTISNAESATAPLEDPFLVDLLPQGSTLFSTQEAVEVKPSGESTLKLESMYRNTNSGEQGVFFFFKGSLQPGDYAEISFKVRAENAVTAYGTEMKNYVIVGSEKKGYATSDNLQGASFRNANNQWAEGFRSALAVTSMTPERLDSLEKILGGWKDYGFVAAYKGVRWSAESQVVLVKSAYGDLNESDGYTSTELSAVSNGGEMHYRLTLSNTSEIMMLTDITVLDLLPDLNDRTVSTNSPRWSEWKLDFDQIETIYWARILSVNGEDQVVMQEIPDDGYRVFYYTGSGGSAQIYDQAENLKYDSTDLPNGWLDSLDGIEKAEIRAFAVAINPEEVVLSASDSLIVDFAAEVNGGEGLSPEELREISYTNAVNSFAAHYSTVNIYDDPPIPMPYSEVLGSNSVSSTIMPELVKVGGHIWIDKNANGIRETGESIDNFQNDTIIQDLLENVEVNLLSFQGTEKTPTIKKYDQTQNLKWTTEANFIFEDLYSAALKDTLTPYQDEMKDGVLDPSKLRGTKPSTYQIRVDLPSGSDAVKGNFKVTKVNEEVLYSRDPVQLQENGSFFKTEAFDNNYTADGANSLSERFYLWASSEDIFDNTKDIGFVPYRTLELTKTNENGDSLAGAEFAVYGPFDPDDTTRACTDENLVGGKTYTTDASGRITVEDLLWYMDYVIVEKTAPEGYTASSAEAEALSAGTNLESLGSGKWLLRTPADTKEDAVDTVRVVNNRYKRNDDPPTNPRRDPLPPPQNDGTTVSFTPVVRKAVLGDARSQESTFRFLLTADGNNPAGAVMTGTSASVTGSGTASFGSIVFSEPGAYRFYLREDTSQQAEGYTYDATVWTLRVTVAETNGRLSLAAAPTYEAGGTQRTGDAQIVNTYSAEPPTEPTTEPPETPDTAETPDGGEPADIPQTGDNTGLFLWLALFVVSGTGLAAVGFRRVVIRRRMRRRVPPQK